MSLRRDVEGFEKQWFAEVGCDDRNQPDEQEDGEASTHCLIQESAILASVLKLRCSPLPLPSGVPQSVGWGSCWVGQSLRRKLSSQGVCPGSATGLIQVEPIE